ncbi:MAG: 7-carboxy-7-deazaguanine synthase QueE [Candidatus Firestonebacteria bacterium]
MNKSLRSGKRLPQNTFSLPGAWISEIFSSIQGEGIYVGKPQLFVRLCGCNLSCIYCDTKNNNFTNKNLRTIPDVVKTIRFFNNPKNLYNTVVFTGGEPLLQAKFLKTISPIFKKEGFKIYLETNGILSKELKYVINDVDIISMDMKLPSSTGINGLWEKHLEFLRIASKKNTFVKTIVTPYTLNCDIKKCVQIISKVNCNVPLVLQPATPKGTIKLVPVKTGIKKFPTLKQLLNWYVIAKSQLTDVRIIPQVHKIMDVR